MFEELVWPFTAGINCSSDLKKFANSRPSGSNFKSFSRSLEHFFLTVGQNNFGNKIPFLLQHTIPGHDLSFFLYPCLTLLLQETLLFMHLYIVLLHVLFHKQRYAIKTYPFANLANKSFHFFKRNYLSYTSISFYHANYTLLVCSSKNISCHQIFLCSYQSIFCC